MSIENVVRKFAVQTAVYWGTPTADGYGGYTYADPVEIKVRWDEKMKVVNNRKAEEIISNAQILTNSELELEGMVFLGTLSDLDELDLDIESGETYPRPELVEGAFRIESRDKIPMPRSTRDFVRIFYLKPNWEQKI